MMRRIVARSLARNRATIDVQRHNTSFKPRIHVPYEPGEHTNRESRAMIVPINDLVAPPVFRRELTATGIRERIG